MRLDNVSPEITVITACVAINRREYVSEVSIYSFKVKSVIIPVWLENDVQVLINSRELVISFIFRPFLPGVKH